MSEPQEQWTKSQRIAFPFIQKAVSEGLTATAAINEYRAGGGAIRSQDWYSLFRQEFAQTGVRENIKEIPYTYTIPETMFDPRDWDTRGKYVVQMRVWGYSEELDTYIEKWVSVESDLLRTKAEYRTLAQQAVFDTIGSPDFTISEIRQWDAVRSTRFG
jgi:hypothetical protein